MNNIPQKLVDALANRSELSDIAQLHVCRYASDASGAIKSGSVLLAIATVSDDQDGDGFRYLIGLPKGTKVTPHLSCFFSGY